MREQIDVLVIEDREPVRGTLERAFARNSRFEFKVVALEKPGDCKQLDLEKGAPSFDVIVSDLGFKGPRQNETLQYAVLLCRAYVKVTGVIVVYSGHPEPQNVVNAILSGADDFVSKGDCPPNQLPDRIATLLESRRRREKEFALVMRWLSAAPKFPVCFAGKFVALVVELEVVRVVASGDTPLEVLLAYSEARQKSVETSWPEEPFVHKVGKLVEP